MIKPTKHPREQEDGTRPSKRRKFALIGAGWGLKMTENGRKTTLVGAPNPILEQVETEDREEDTEKEPSQGDRLQMFKEEEETLEPPSLKFWVKPLVLKQATA